MAALHYRWAALQGRPAQGAATSHMGQLKAPAPSSLPPDGLVGPWEALRQPSVSI